MLLTRRARRLSGDQLLNPYVALADVTINLLLIVTAFFYLSSRIAEAYYATQEASIRERAQNSEWGSPRVGRVNRQGRQLEFRTPTANLFMPNSSALHQPGVRRLAALAKLLGDPAVRTKFEVLRITVTQPANTAADLALTRATVIKGRLKPALAGIPIVAAGRMQDNPFTRSPGGVSIVLQLKEPWRESNPDDQQG